MNEPLLIVENIVKKYDNKVVLKGISFKVKRGMIYSLLGPNGAGKTTLLSIIAGIINPTDGKILVNGSDPRNPETRKYIGYCPQEPAVYEELTGYENMMFYARLYGLNENNAKEKINELLEKVGLYEHRYKKVSKYSGGMKKRLSLSITLLINPVLFILDEPTTGMDPNMRRIVWDIVKELRNKGKAIVLATHYMDEADVLSDRVAIINDGEIIVEGSPEELKLKYGPGSVIVLEFYKVPSEKIIDMLKSFSETIYKENNVIKVYAQNPDEIVPNIVTTLYKHGISLSSLRVVRPTLEDVFLKLTGRRLEE